MKDLFSAGARTYAQYRPSYPRELFDHLATLVPAKTAAWDCATGNGQAAIQLAPHFASVTATDISVEQIAHAEQRPNIRYLVSPAESTPFADGSFDLVTVAQAIHWFDFDRFYAETLRVLKPGGVLAVIGYPTPTISPAIDTIIREYHDSIIGPYWDPERRYVDEHYRTIPFPFPELPAPAFSLRLEWDAEQLLGYLSTWSAARHYRDLLGSEPTTLIGGRIAEQWPQGESLVVTFPLLLRIGRTSS